MGTVTSKQYNVQLPFASATTGRRPKYSGAWALKSAGQPLAYGRSLHDMARSLHGGH